LPNGKSELESAIIKAVELHGHLGPFLVIGVRMGLEAKRSLILGAKGNHGLQVNARLPLLIPFSCTIDGIQATTRCTIGNQKLRLEDSQKEIAAHFELQNPNKAFDVFVSPRVVEELKQKMSEGTTNEELAAWIASMPEDRLFALEKQTKFPSPKQSSGLNECLQDLKIAEERLDEKVLTLSIVKQGKIVFETDSHGISGFLKAIEEYGEDLEGASVADKVVGNAVALLCVYAKIAAVYAATVSRSAKAMLEENSIQIKWNNLVQNILGRDRVSACPFEELARKIKNPADTYKKFKVLHRSLRQCR
jgi:formylmethanofuran dehydrogenase subunit E